MFRRLRVFHCTYRALSHRVGQVSYTLTPDGAVLLEGVQVQGGQKMAVAGGIPTPCPEEQKGLLPVDWSRSFPIYQ